MERARTTPGRWRGRTLIAFALIWGGAGCVTTPLSPRRDERVRLTPSVSPGPTVESSAPRPDPLRGAARSERRPELPFVLTGSRGFAGEGVTVGDSAVLRRKIDLVLEDIPLPEVLLRVATAADLELVCDARSLEEQRVSLRARALTLASMFEELESSFPVTLALEGARLRATARTGPRLALLVHPLPGGLVDAASPLDFEALRQLSFISRSQREGSTAAEVALPERDEPLVSHLESFLERLPKLVPWPDGSSWFLDRRRNVLLVRSSPEALAQVRRCLELLCRPPRQVEIETRFVEMSERAARDLGVELGLGENAVLRRRGGEPQVVLGGESATRLGVPQLLGGADGLRLSVLGLLSEPRFFAVIRALEESGEGEVLSAPAVTAVNNSRATIAVTTNLPYVEGYRPIFDRELVASEGVSATESSVALIAEINDRNFTGIVLDVTPSVGAEADRIQLRLQPVVRAQVDEITISSGAVVEGVPTPAIARPVVETRFLDTRMAIPDGATLVLGGLRSTTVVREETRVPLLASIPIIGRLFRREVSRRERRDLVIFVTARLVAE